MNHQVALLIHRRARQRTLCALALFGMVLGGLSTATAGPGAPKDRPGAHEPGKGPPPGAQKKGLRDKFGGDHEGRPGRDDKRHEHDGGTSPGAGSGEHHHGGPPEAMKQRFDELTQKEKAGTLSEDEKKELARMKEMQAHRQTRQQRQARLAELKQKESTGTLTAEEKAELEKLQQVQTRYEAVEKHARERAATRQQRSRDAKRQALKEYPGLQTDAQAKAEYQKHAERLAKLERAKELATASQNNDQLAKIEKLTAQENQRHQTWITNHPAQPSQGAKP
jgi:hypothetical protein